MAEHLQAQIVQTAVLINELQQALILFTHDGKWQLPGGRLNEGERWDDGLRREILEETGIADVEILSVMMVDNWEYRGVLMYGTYFLCRTKSVNVRLSEEHTDCRWISKNDDLDAIDFWHQNLRMLVQKAQQLPTREI